MIKRAPLVAFFAFFALYLWTMPPGLAPYRDTGEMALSAHTLGVSHPPGYPLYILLGRAWDLFPFGVPEHSLNLLSASAAALCLALLLRALAGAWGLSAAAVAVVLLGTNSTFWSTALVQEMYSLHLLLACVLWSLALELRREFRLRLWYAAAFLYGLFLGNRTDLLLWAPGLLILSLPLSLREASGRERLAFAARTAGFLALGLSIYLYLPLRSLRGPWLDWNHPAQWNNLLGSLTRRGYGGTLDLISKNYAPGAMFLPNLAVYARHLWHCFGAVGLALTVWGAVAAWREPDRRRFWGTALLFLLGGPVFLFLANMPPNPHALAIVEPHYLLADFLLCVWAAEGALALKGSLPSAAALIPAVLPVLVLIQPFAGGRWTEMDRRWNLLGHDYPRNVLRSAPPGSIVVAKKDVQIFGLWDAHRVAGLRPEVGIVAQGLAHSPWYQRSIARLDAPGAALGRLDTAEEWGRFTQANAGKVYATTDVELPPGVTIGPPSGLLSPLFPAEGADAAPWEFLIRRGEYRYDARPDFFTADLVEAYAVSRYRLGAQFLERGDAAAARRCLREALAMKALFPEAASYLAFLDYRGGDFAAAVRSYELADGLYAETLELARRYHTLPDAVRGIAGAAADVRLNLGVAYEKLGRPADAERMYRGAIELRPDGARGHFNIAVLYWNKDWPTVAAELEAALRLDPGNEETRRYLTAARSRLRAR
ncbi:MAG: hypothetical protein A2X36_07755 [Elusimicrobia bacterium GWA2_69_24]|nr:MAG: hypothetical protein A2X36_07755 [Elusimicrobia bacterium GWA2_69_24]HBL16022.1 hypothetical protein [Elusimicrobiota bacterium]